MRTAMPLLFVLIAAHVCEAQVRSLTQDENRFVGAWTANLSKSKLDPKYPFKGATLTISVSGDTVTLASELIDSSGKPQRAKETVRTDGTETRGTLTAGITHFARWVGPDVLAMTPKKDGQLIALVTYEVSADGKTLTARTSGILDQLVVFER